MPGGDRTGPMGMGPMTGRGAGFCGGAGAPGVISRMGGAFLGRGRGRGGRGWRNMFYATGLPGWMRSGPGGVAPATAEASGAEKQFLQEQVELLQSQLEAVKKRLAEFQAPGAEK